MENKEIISEQANSLDIAKLAAHTMVYEDKMDAYESKRIQHAENISVIQASEATKENLYETINDLLQILDEAIYCFEGHTEFSGDSLSFDDLGNDELTKLTDFDHEAQKTFESDENLIDETIAINTDKSESFIEAKKSTLSTKEKFNEFTELLIIVMMFS
ncbi:hypothetical protein Bhyg_15683, partial [Pseudolycoriella hygida]